MIFGNDLVSSEHLKLFVDISRVKEQQKKKTEEEWRKLVFSLFVLIKTETYFFHSRELRLQTFITYSKYKYTALQVRLVATCKHNLLVAGDILFEIKIQFYYFSFQYKIGKLDYFIRMFLFF